MKRRDSEAEQLREQHTAAKAKVEMWTTRAGKARLAGRRVDANRCDDKVRDWESKARQIERAQKTET